MGICLDPDQLRVTALHQVVFGQHHVSAHQARESDVGM